MSSRSTHMFNHGGVPFKTALIGSAVAAACLLVLAGFPLTAPLLKAPDAWIEDWRTAHFSPRVPELRDDITVILIDEQSLERYVWFSPVNRVLQATLVRGLEEAGARAIGMDFLYTSPTTAADDRALREAFKAAGTPIVIGAIDERGVPRTADAQSALAWQDQFIASTGRVAGHLYFHGAATTMGRFGIADQVVRKRLGPSPAPPYRDAFPRVLAIEAGIEKLPSPISAPQPIAWQRPPVYSLWPAPMPVLRVMPHAPGASIDDMLGDGWRSFVKGRIVIVGGGFGDRDRHLTPLSTATNDKVEGVRIHAQILGQLIDGRSVAILPQAVEFVLLMGGTLLTWSLARRTLPLPFGRWLTGAPRRFRPDPGGLAELSLTGLTILLSGLAIYAVAGVIMPSATIFSAFVIGLLLGNPPHWLAWLLRRLPFATPPAPRH
ncbi:MAG: CHASE2 domain-containing protein [Pseudomonadota bacterium]